jgi:hypothetical protein
MPDEDDAAGQMVPIRSTDANATRCEFFDPPEAQIASPFRFITPLKSITFSLSMLKEKAVAQKTVKPVLLRNNARANTTFQHTKAPQKPADRY